MKVYSKYCMHTTCYNHYFDRLSVLMESALWMTHRKYIYFQSQSTSCDLKWEIKLICIWCAFVSLSMKSRWSVIYLTFLFISFTVLSCWEKDKVTVIFFCTKHLLKESFVSLQSSVFLVKWCVYADWVFRELIWSYLCHFFKFIKYFAWKVIMRTINS